MQFQIIQMSPVWSRSETYYIRVMAVLVVLGVFDLKECANFGLKTSNGSCFRELKSSGCVYNLKISINKRLYFPRVLAVKLKLKFTLILNHDFLASVDFKKMDVLSFNVDSLVAHLEVQTFDLYVT